MTLLTKLMDHLGITVRITRTDSEILILLGLGLVMGLILGVSVGYPIGAQFRPENNRFVLKEMTPSTAIKLDTQTGQLWQIRDGRATPIN